MIDAREADAALRHSISTHLLPPLPNRLQISKMYKSYIFPSRYVNVFCQTKLRQNGRGFNATRQSGNQTSTMLAILLIETV